MADEKVACTVYVAGVHQAVDEAQLRALFQAYGPLVECRLCGDPHSRLRFAFVEFVSRASARAALTCSGMQLNACFLRVTPSRTPIVAVDASRLPRSEEERAAVARTVYVTNVDRMVACEALLEFFQSACGPVDRIRLLGDARRAAKIAFVQFVSLQSAQAALQCSGVQLGRLTIRVNVSKTAVSTSVSTVTPAAATTLTPPAPCAVAAALWPDARAAPLFAQ